MLQSGRAGLCAHGLSGASGSVVTGGSTRHPARAIPKEPVCSTPKAVRAAGQLHPARGDPAPAVLGAFEEARQRVES